VIPFSPAVRLLCEGDKQKRLINYTKFKRSHKKMKNNILNKIVLLTLCFTLSASSALAQTGNGLSIPQNQTSGAAAQQKSSAVRVGLAGVKTGAVGEGMNAQELSGAIQNLLGEYLKGSSVEIVPLEAKLAQAVEAEAKSKDCAFVLYATVSHKKGGGGGGFGKMFSSVAPMLSNVIPMTGGVGGAIAGSVASTAATAAAGAMSNVKPKDEITLDIKLQNGAGVTLAKQYKGKAKSGGEDILTPMIEQAAQAILDAAK
jgi:hypothetical protein